MLPSSFCQSKPYVFACSFTHPDTTWTVDWTLTVSNLSPRLFTYPFQLKQHHARSSFSLAVSQAAHAQPTLMHEWLDAELKSCSTSATPATTWDVLNCSRWKVWFMFPLCAWDRFRPQRNRAEAFPIRPTDIIYVSFAGEGFRVCTV